MLVDVEKPEMERFVQEQLKTGRFQRPEDVVDSALAQMQQSIESKKLDELRAEIKVGLDELDRGEGVPWNKADIMAKFEALAASRRGH